MDNNSGGNYRVVADEFGKFFERFENFEIEKRNITELQKEVMVEAKSRGHDCRFKGLYNILDTKTAPKNYQMILLLFTYCKVMTLR